MQTNASNISDVDAKLDGLLWAVSVFERVLEQRHLEECRKKAGATA